VHDEEFGPRIDAVRESLPMLQFTIAIGTSEYDDALAQGSPDRDFPERADDDIYILYTGGTTGMPKGVVWRQEDVLCVLGGLVDFNTGIRVEDEWEFANTAKDTEPIISVIIAPLMHGAAQWGVLNGLLKGTTSVMLKKFDADEVWKAVDKYKIMTLSITGDAMGRPLIEALEAGDYEATSLVTVASTAALFSATLKEQYLDRFPNLIIADAVGSTESGYNGVRVIVKGSEERPGPPTIQMGPETVVLDDDLNIVQPGSGVVGRMARGGHVPLRYHKDPEKSAATFVTVDGKRYSIPGDFARVEEDGSMTLLGRGSVSINSGGEKIYPEEVEAALKAHDAVFDALVVGVPDERWGQRVAAVVELRPGFTVTLDELDVHAREHIAGYKVPRELHLVDKIERSPSGKPDYPWATTLATSSEPSARR
jgi:acyl-CoA synthetase (AMP-forming)/AMP-acid ligase II